MFFYVFFYFLRNGPVHHVVDIVTVVFADEEKEWPLLANWHNKLWQEDMNL